MPLVGVTAKAVRFALSDFSNEASMRKFFDGTFQGNWSYIDGGARLEYRIPSPATSTQSDTVVVIGADTLVVERGDDSIGNLVVFPPELNGNSHYTVHAWDYLNGG